MTELRSILKAYRAQLAANKKMALVTVLRVQGSSYRQPGARMLITEEGEIFGSVSGGCLERNLIQQAQVAFHSNTAQTTNVANSPASSALSGLPKRRVIQYDTTEDGDEHEALKSVSLACQGIIDMSLEILNAGEPNAFLESLSESLVAENTVLMATSVSTGERFGGDAQKIPAEIDRALQSLNRTTVKNFGDTAVLLEKFNPPQRWVIFGASHDSVPLAQLGRFLGWHITVVNCHSSYTVPERFFSEVDELVKCKPSEVSTKVRLGSKTLCALVTHNYYHDMEILKQLIQSDVGYIGLLGPKKKGITILEDLKKEMPGLDQTGLIQLHSPAGLDTGAEDPHGVALSIIAEASAVIAGRTGGFLRDRPGPIHSRDLA